MSEVLLLCCCCVSVVWLTQIPSWKPSAPSRCSPFLCPGSFWDLPPPAACCNRLTVYRPCWRVGRAASLLAGLTVTCIQREASGRSAAPVAVCTPASAACDVKATALTMGGCESDYPLPFHPVLRGVYHCAHETFCYMTKFEHKAYQAINVTQLKYDVYKWDKRHVSLSLSLAVIVLLLLYLCITVSLHCVSVSLYLYLYLYLCIYKEDSVTRCWLRGLTN